MAPSTLPSLMVLGSDGQFFDKFKNETTMFSRLYLGCVPNGSDYGNVLKYDFKASDPAAKFAVESAKVGGGLVHIRSCFNNKYWCRNDGNTQAIVAGASEPVEDTSTWQCTLFKPSISSNSSGEDTVVFRHVETNTDLHLADRNYDAPRNYLTTNDTYRTAISMVKAYDSLLMLPKTVVFQGYNNKYLRAEGNTALTFTETDALSEWIVQDMYQTGDNKVRFNNRKIYDFWTCHAYLDIKADANSGGYDDDYTLFELSKLDVDKGIIAIRCLSNNKFCKADGNTLRASADNLVNEARFRVLEPVSKRNIKVNFRLDEAIIYNQSPITMAETSGKNDSYTQTDSLSLAKAVEYTETRSWTNTVGLKTGVETTIQSGIPRIAEAGITVTTEATYEHQWATTQEDKQNITATYSMSLEPRTMGTIKLVATKGSCDVPFSYTQTDTLYNGKTVTTELQNGVYKGLQYYSFVYETTRKSIDNAKGAVVRKLVRHPTCR